MEVFYTFVLLIGLFIVTPILCFLFTGARYNKKDKEERTQNPRLLLSLQTPSSRHPGNKMKQITVSLSRAHNLANRLNKIAVSLQDKAHNTLSNTYLSYAPDDEDAVRIAKLRDIALNRIATAHQIANTVGQIRAVLAKENAKYGITEMLAVVSAIQAKKRWVEELVKADLLSKVPLDKVSNALETQGLNASSIRTPFHTKSGANVAVASFSDVEGFERLAVKLSSEMSSLLDKVNTLNKNEVTLSIDEEGAELAGV